MEQALRLRVAQADVELEDHGAARGHHQSRIEEAAEGDAVGAHAVNRGPEDGFMDMAALRFI